MKKVLRCYEILLPSLIACLIAFLAVSFEGVKNTNGDLGEGIAAVFSIILGSIPAFILAALCLVLLVIAICLILKKNKKGALVAALVFTCLLVLVFAVYFTIAVSLLDKIYVTVFAVLSAFLLAICFVLNCILVRNSSKLFATEKAD